MAFSFAPWRVREALVEKGLNSTQLGALIGRTSVTVDGYVAGRWRPSLQALAAIADVLGKPVGYFFTDSTEPCPDRTVPMRGRRGGARSGAPPGDEPAEPVTAAAA